MATGSPSKLRILNDQTALRFMISAGQISRAELEQLTGLSKPATAELLGRLEAAGLVKKCGKRSGGPGPKAQLWSVRPEAGYAAGIDVRPGSVKVVISDISGGERSTAERMWAGTATARQVHECLEDACREIGLDRASILHAVVSVPGSLDPGTGLMKYSPELPSWEGSEVALILEAELQIPVEVENDVNLIALSEMNDGLAGPADNFALVWIDEGFGAAIVLDGELYRGPRGAAGEIGYVRLPDTFGAGLGTGSYGMKLGDLLTAAGIAKLAEKHHLDFPGPEAALEAALAGEVTAQAFLHELVCGVAVGLTAVITVLDPELILLGGRFGSRGGRNLAHLVQEELSRLLPAPPGSMARVISCPTDDDAALSGALQTALIRAREKAFETGSIVMA